MPIGKPAAPWQRVGNYAIGGLTAVGFAGMSDLLLVVSSQGRGVFDCLTGTRVAREAEGVGNSWYDEVRLTASGIGPLGHQLIRMSGLHGGGLSTCTDDRWAVTRIAPDWPREAIVLDPPGSSVLYQDHAGGCVKIAEDFELRAYGFSETGRSLIVANSDHFQLWNRPG